MTTILLKSKRTNPQPSTRPTSPALRPSSIRVPVTRANREYLRALRQAELEAWRNAPGGTRPVNRG